MTTYDDPNADIVINTDEDVRIIAARNVTVVRCGTLNCWQAKISRLDCRDATIATMDCRGATIAILDCRGATIGTMDCWRAAIGTMDCWRAAIGTMDCWQAAIGILDCRQATIACLDCQDATIGTLDCRGATIHGIPIGEPTADEIAILRQIPLDRLDMTAWHGDGWAPDQPGDCRTTHCLAGWAQALSTDPEIRTMDPVDAGRMLLPNLSYLFYAPQDVALRHIAEILA